MVIVISGEQLGFLFCPRFDVVHFEQIFSQYLVVSGKFLICTIHKMADVWVSMI